MIHRVKQGYDNATPNGNGIAAVALQRLGHILGEPRYLQSAERTLRAFDAVIKRSPTGGASLLHALSEYLTPPTMVIVRGPSEQLRHWRTELNKNYYPHHLFFFLDETAKVLPGTLQRKISDDVNAWVCKGVECSQSVVDLPSLLNQM